MNTPTPRTDAAVELTFAAGHNTVCPNFARALERKLAALTTERDELRAEVLNESHWAAHYLTQAITDRARAERAEAELAAERARLDCLRDAVVEIVWDRQGGPGVMRGDGHCFYGDLRAAIDEAMKEGAK